MGLRTRCWRRPFRECTYDTPNGLQSSSGVGLAKRGFDQARIVEPGHQSLPYLERQLRGDLAAALITASSNCSAE